MSIEELKIEYEKLSEETITVLDNWIKSLKTAKDYNYDHTSIGLVNQFGILSNSMFGKPFSVSNEQMKYAMYKSGFEPDEKDEYAWCFKINEKQDFKWSV